jgi:hypothetical protein
LRSFGGVSRRGGSVGRFDLDPETASRRNEGSGTSRDGVAVLAAKTTR